MFAEGNADTRLQETTSLTFEHDAHGERDAALQRLKLADAPREGLFDEITQLAAEAVGAPFALITIIDKHRQFFVSSHGLPSDRREHPIDTSLCRWSIESASPVAIFNARTNPLSAPTGAWQWGCQSYLATPVFFGDVAIATLCVADREVREWTRRDLATLEGLARLLARELDNRVLVHDLAEDIAAREQAQDALRMRNRQLDLVSRSAARLLQGGKDAQAVLREVLDDLAETIGLDAALCFCPAPELAETADFSDHIDIPFVRMGWLRDCEPLCIEAGEQRQPLIITDLGDCALPGTETLRAAGVVSYAGFPLRAGESLLGTLAFAAPHPVQLDRDELQAIETICGHIATYLDHLRLKRLTEERELQLRESEASFRRVFDNAAVALLKTDWSAVLARFEELRAAGIVDLEAYLAEHPSRLDELLSLVRMIDVNPETLHLFGAKDREELIRRRAEGGFGKEAREADRQTLLIAWRGESGLQSECHLQTLQGEAIDVVFSIRFSGRNGERALTSIMNIGEVKRVQARLRVAYKTMRQVIERSPFGTFVVDADLRIQVASKDARGMFGLADPVLGTDCEVAFKTAWSEPFASEMVAQLRHTLDTGETYRVTSRVARRAGSGETQSFDWQLERFEMPDGSSGIVGRFYDQSERYRQDQQIRTLMQEVNHRSKNILSLVQAVALQTAARSPEEFMPRFIERIRALSAAQDLLINGAWRSVDLRTLIESQLAHFQDALDTGRIVLSGPNFAVSAAAAQSLGMAFHELATNAGKYGALSRPQGHVAISWQLGAGDIDLQWRETGGPVTPVPAHHGFGTVVIKDLLRSALDGDVQIEFAPTGLIWRARCPQERLREAAQSNPPWQDTSASRAADTNKGSGRILLVEDEALVAMDLAESLRDAGFTVLGPASTQLQAHALLDREDCDLAVLDVNLGNGESSASLAARLAEKQVPCLFLTGYAPDQLASPFRGGEVIGKPVTATQLTARVARLLSRPAS